MSEMVERCAQAAAEDADLLWDMLSDKHDMVCGTGMPEGCKDYWRMKVRAVLQAMREPTEAMRKAGAESPYNMDYDIGPYAAERAWQMMTDAALEDPRHG